MLPPKGKATKGSDFSGVKIRVISADMKTKPARELAKGEGNE